MLPSVRVRSCPHTDPRLWGGDEGVASRGGQGRGGKGLPTRPLRPLATLLSLPHPLLRPPHFLWSPQCSASDVTWPSPSVGKPPLATEGLAPGCRPGSGGGMRWPGERPDAQLWARVPIAAPRPLAWLGAQRGKANAGDLSPSHSQFAVQLARCYSIKKLNVFK